MGDKKYRKQLEEEARACERAANKPYKDRGYFYSHTPEQLQRQADELRRLASEL